MDYQRIEQIHFPKVETSPIFVGRDAHLKKGAAGLEAGRVVFVHGEYGIGKSSFAKAMARNLGEPFGVLDLQRTAAQTLDTFILGARRKGLLKGLANPSKRKKQESFQDAQEAFRFLVEKKGLGLLVLDNVFSATRPKLEFIAYLLKLELRLIIVMETDIHPDSLFQLRAVCQRDLQLKLPKLNALDSEAFLKEWQDHYGLALSPKDLKRIAKQQNGYPQFLHERVMELHRHVPLYHPS
ncbi:MAG: ATP-binding protein [Proteobacteria bacterium]|nr:MAG: ATP-binding protein [Pseudomonadota bacterium]